MARICRGSLLLVLALVFACFGPSFGCGNGIQPSNTFYVAVFPDVHFNPFYDAQADFIDCVNSH
jgi:hypothetical protein